MEKDMNYGDDYKYLPITSLGNGLGIEVLPDLYCFTIQIVNILLVGDSKDDFVLIDAGMPGSAKDIIAAVENHFGPNSCPKAIILTHGHFDHVGAIIDLVRYWEVSVYAHEAELPFLTGNAKYPEPDPTVEGGMIAKMAALFPNEPINLGNHVQKLPQDGSIPHMPSFRWIHTPGHSPGHVSLFRDEDRVLIVGDAFVTVKQDSFYKVLTQKLEVTGPPRYFTTDWKVAKESVTKLAALKPTVVVTGHGLPISGDFLANSLEKLVSDFDTIAIPSYGKYVN